MVPFFAAFLSTATGCALSTEDPNAGSSTDSTADELRKSACSKAFAEELQGIFDNGDTSQLVAVKATALPSAVEAKLNALNAKRTSGGFDTLDPFTYTSPTGTAFVLYFNGGDDGDVVIEAFNASGTHLVSGSASCSCEPIDWVNVCKPGAR
jgi:hypothetical protein